MQIGIVGLPQSGRTTLFNALTRGAASVSSSTGAPGQINVGVAKVADLRLHRLSEIFSPRRSRPAEITYIDSPPSPDATSQELSISAESLNRLQGADALLLVVRAFENPSVVHAEGSVDPFRDIDSVLFELALTDVSIVERRIARLQRELKGAKASERQGIESEQSFLAKLKTSLEAGTAVRDQSATESESLLIKGFSLLTAKPLIITVNVGEQDVSGVPALEERLSAGFDAPGTRTTALCGTLEMELAEMATDEEQEFREALGAGEPGLDRMIALAHDVCDMITFFTGNDNEVHAWTVTTGTTALKAAGRVHTDFERGFIRAETIAYDDFDACGSVAEARKRGLLRQEGKDYIVKDGDVLNILFNV